MRRGVALLVSLSVVGWLTPSLFGQYPYPYAPPVYQPAPMPYGYYPPAPMPGYYPPAPMPGNYPPASGPRVFVYGPLEDPQPAPVQPAPKKLPDAVKTAKPAAAPAKTGATPARSGVTQAQATTNPAAKDAAPVARTSFLAAIPTLPTFGACGPEGCGGGCCDGGDSGCPTCIPRDPPRLGHGQFIGEVGANILVPYPSPRQAYNTTTAGVTANSDFAHDADAGPFVSLGYLAHNGWGVRADYWYLNGSQTQTAANGSVNTVVGTPLGSNFQFTSPSATLQQGIGNDLYSFGQALTLNVADLEVLKEAQVMDTTFLFGTGVRYARVVQTYSATQSNPGGANGIVTVALDQQDANASNVFEGWGPTLSLEVIHAIPRSCFSIYGNVRGSFLWGNDTFTQSLRNQNNTVTVAGAANPIDTTTSTTVVNHREVSIGEAEVGLQYGGRCGPCYVFVRAGASFQRWWDVGSPSSGNGNLSFIGGVARVGVSY